jgi:ribonuclease HI
LSTIKKRSAGPWVVFSDGAAKGNPGPSGAGWLIRDSEGQVRSENGKFLGHGTNNEAEYQALTAALEEALALGAEAVQVHLDSELLVRQLNGQYRVKSDRLRKFYLQAQDLLRRFRDYAIMHIPREKNQEADRLANEAITAHFKMKGTTGRV